MGQGRSQTFVWVSSFRGKGGPFFLRDQASWMSLKRNTQKAEFGNFSVTKWYKIKTSYVDGIVKVYHYIVHCVTTICVYDNYVLDYLIQVRKPDPFPPGAVEQKKDREGQLLQAVWIETRNK